MNRVRMITHNKKNIVLVDLSNGDVDEILNTLKEASGVIARQNPKSARILTDVTNATYNRVVSDAIKSFSAGNTPYVHSSAVTGVEGIRFVLVQAVTMITRREIKVFTTQKDALDFLAN